MPRHPADKKEQEEELQLLLKHELEAMEAIYGDSFHVIQQRQHDSCAIVILQMSNIQTSSRQASLHLSLESGYPLHTMAIVTGCRLGSGASKAREEEVKEQLQQLSENLLGGEALLELFQAFERHLSALEGSEAEPPERTDGEPTLTAQNQSVIWGRRWIWVHHITNRERVRSIVREAQQRHLNGFCKSGYPGIVVIEGIVTACDDFVKFIKGSKSCPNGFGRNWGHHLRGHLDDVQPSMRDFGELTDMSELSRRCRDCGLEDEFLQFAMQHTPAVSS